MKLGRAAYCIFEPLEIRLPPVLSYYYASRVKNAAAILIFSNAIFI